jgi:hypothetical protein
MSSRPKLYAASGSPPAAARPNQCAAAAGSSSRTQTNPARRWSATRPARAGSLQPVARGAQVAPGEGETAQVGGRARMPAGDGEPVHRLGGVVVPARLQQQAQVVRRLGVPAPGGELPPVPRLVLRARRVGEEAQVVRRLQVAVERGGAMPVERLAQRPGVLVQQRQPARRVPRTRAGGALEPAGGGRRVALVLKQQGGEVHRRLGVARPGGELVPAETLLEGAVLLVPDAQVVRAVHVSGPRRLLPPPPRRHPVAAPRVQPPEPVGRLRIAGPRRLDQLGHGRRLAGRVPRDGRRLPVRRRRRGGGRLRPWNTGDRHGRVGGGLGVSHPQPHEARLTCNDMIAQRNRHPSCERPADRP